MVLFQGCLSVKIQSNCSFQPTEETSAARNSATSIAAMHKILSTTTDNLSFLEQRAFHTVCCFAFGITDFRLNIFFFFFFTENDSFIFDN